MADAPRSDPFALFRDMVSTWERQVNAVANATMGSDEFSGAMNGAMNVSLKLQQSMVQSMAAYLATLNLPSRQDILTVGERVEACEAHLARLVALAERDAAAREPGAADAARAMPPRTKRPAAHVAAAKPA